MSERNRKRSAAKVQRLLPGVAVHDYVPARSGMQPFVAVLVLLGCFAALSAALVAATGTFVFPGVLLVLGLQHLISPPRALAVCDRGIAVTDRSFLNGKPSRIVALADVGYVQPVRASGGQVLVQAGSEQVWLPRKEEARFRTAVSALRPAWTGGGSVPQPYT